METQPLSQINGQPIRHGRRRDVTPDDGLYRYEPVPPVYRDEDGYLLEDGMSQNDGHLSQTTFWYEALKLRLPGATVCSDLPLHYERGDTDKTVVPDLFVALRAPRLDGRSSYKLWEHPVPELVIEMLSKSTSKADVGSKRHTYEHLGVIEYWLFDPEGFRLPAPLRGYRLRAGRYRQIAADGAGRMSSEVLGLELHVRDGELRFRDPATGEDLNTYVEVHRRADLAELEQEAEKQRADQAERGRAEEKHRADEAEHGRAAEKRRADGEKHRADMAEHERAAQKTRAEAAESRAEAAERELARLRSRTEKP